MLLLALFGFRYFLKKYPGGLGGFWSENKPILLVLIYTALIILASPLVRPWTYNLTDSLTLCRLVFLCRSPPGSNSQTGHAARQMVEMGARFGRRFSATASRTRRSVFRDSAGQSLFTAGDGFRQPAL